jgi:acetolactate synthase-1/2/3 large subunit
LDKTVRKTVGELIVGILKAQGIDRAFGVPGESFLPVLDGMYAENIEMVTARHESAAGYMALADARLTGLPGVCVVSRGPGATNASIAVHTAEQDGLPFLLLIGQVPRISLGRGSFQEIDYKQMYGGIAKWVAEITDATTAEEIITRAVLVAISGTPGPVIVSLPEDVLEEEVAAPPARKIYPVNPTPSRDTVAAVADRLKESKRPLFIAGQGLDNEVGRELLIKASESWNAPVGVSFRRHNVFPGDHPLFAGEVAIYNTPSQLEAFDSSDLIIAIGTRLNDLTTHGYSFPKMPWPNQPLVHVHVDPKAIGRNYMPAFAVPSDAVAFLSMLSEYAPSAPPARAEWVETLTRHREAQYAFKSKTAPDGVVFTNVVKALGRHMEQDAIVVPDAGLSAANVYRYLDLTGKRRLMATIAGVMGFSMPGAVAMAMRKPKTQVICIAGDGGFMMSSNELALAVERNLRICILLSNNRSLGTIRFHQERYYPGHVVGTDLAGPNFAKLAESFGCPAISLTREEDIDSVLADALGRQGPVLVDISSSLSAVLPVR